jgi:CRP-like cAMP-binding protein
LTYGTSHNPAERQHRHREDTAFTVLSDETTGQSAHYRSHEHLLHTGDEAAYSHLIERGFAVRYQLTLDGSRQITAIYMCGDFIDLRLCAHHPSSDGLVAMGACSTTKFRNDTMSRAALKSAVLANSLCQLSERNGAIARAWIASIGRRNAEQHLAHIICELFLRAQAAGLTNGSQLRFPATQAHIADMIGLSVVHTNRTLQTLRAAKLVRWDRQMLSIIDLDGLMDLAGFQENYLQHPGMAVPLPKMTHH